jgi:hypothetical protein
MPTKGCSVAAAAAADDDDDDDEVPYCGPTNIRRHCANAARVNWRPGYVHPWNNPPPEDEARKFTRSVRKFVQDYTTSHLKRRSSSWVNFSLCLIKYHAMNTHRGVEV